MPKLIVETRDGQRQAIDAKVGLSIMEALRESGIDEVLALCGGCCSCATCHVHIDPAFVDLLPEMGPDEDSLLESANDRDADSRLSCQLPVTEALDGMRIRVAHED